MVFPEEPKSHRSHFIDHTPRTLPICFILQNKELLENRNSRKNRWDEFLKGQYQNCDEIDKDFNEQVERLKTHYDELENKLGYSTKTQHD